MENNTNHHHHPHHHLNFLIILLLTMLISTTKSQPMSPSPSPSSLSQPIQQLNNIIDALIGAGDFTSWMAILSMANPSVFPLSATLFIPQDTTFLHNHPPLDPFLFPYHVVPQRLTFSDLLLLPATARLPTLLPGKTISVTQHSAGNFSLDGTPLTYPDLYTTASIAVHGVADVLDYSLFGDNIPPPPPPPPLPDYDSLSPLVSTTGAGGETRVSMFFLIFCLFGVIASEL